MVITGAFVIVDDLVVLVIIVVDLEEDVFPYLFCNADSGQELNLWEQYFAACGSLARGARSP